MAINKILIDVYIPVAKKSYDMFIPTHLTMYEVLKLIMKIATEMSGGLFVGDENTTICNRKDGTILNINLSVNELGLRNGSKLMLI
ncbi:MAG: EsaB/YukD family protein [Oscillospiraceae bacterium]